MAISTEGRRAFRQNVFRLLFSVAVAVEVITSSLAATESLPYVVRLRSVEQEREIAPLNLDDRKSLYASLLAKSAGSGEAAETLLLYVYENVMSGFAARLTKAEVEAMRNLDGFVDIVPDKLLSLHTTYYSQYVGLDPDQGLWPSTEFGKGVIVGIVDSGVWPKSPSFNDAGIPPPPSRWKGICQTAPDFNSSNHNNKLIGARVFNKVATGTWADEDIRGHGTHTASTAAGNFARNADIFGYANGTARGMAPYSHIAVYKACFGTESRGCSFVDVLAAMDQAIADGVDVLSLSLGTADGSDDSSGASPFNDDFVAIGAFCALQRGFSSAAVGATAVPIRLRLEILLRGS